MPVQLPSTTGKKDAFSTPPSKSSCGGENERQLQARKWAGCLLRRSVSTNDIQYREHEPAEELTVQPGRQPSATHDASCSLVLEEEAVCLTLAVHIHQSTPHAVLNVSPSIGSQQHVGNTNKRSTRLPILPQIFAEHCWK